MGCVGAVSPEDGCAAFGWDDGEVGILHDEEAVADGDAEGAARAAFADDDGEDGGLEESHLHEVAGDGFGDVALFAADASVGGLGVYEADHWELEALGHLHEAEGFAVAFGVGHAEVAGEVFAGVSTLLLGNDHDGFAVEEGGAADEGLIVPKGAVSVELLKIGKDGLNVVEGVGALRVAGELDALPSGEAGIDFLLLFLDALLDRADLVTEV